MKVFGMDGKPIGEIELPKVFYTPLREDLILRAWLSTQSKKRQPYGTDVMAGLRSSAHYHGMRHHRYTMMNRELARLPRLHGKTVPFLYLQARIVPQAKGGRAAHPPKVEKIWEQKINKKERKLAIASAIAATRLKDLVAKKHRIGNLDLPIIVDDKIEEIKKTKDLVTFLKKIGLEAELERVKKKKVRAGKGKMRGRRYKRKVGILFVFADDKGISKAVKNLPGCHSVKVEDLCVDLLAPGGIPGRLTVFSKSAIEKLRAKYGG